MTVPFADPHADYLALRDELDGAYRRVLDSGAYILGDEVESFEREFAAACGTARCVGVGNGLDALTLALRAAGVGAGDEVIVPAHTFVATWLAVRQVGATVVPVDVDPETLLLDARAARAAVGPRTVAVIPVHLYGHVADVRPLEPLGLFVLEDAAQAHGASLAGRRAGSLGNAAAFSFYPTKNLGAFGDGGAVTADDPALAARLARLRNYGSVEKYVHVEAAVNSRLDPLQAAFLRVKLRRLDGWNARRRRIAHQYIDGLTGVPGLELPVVPDACESAWHVFAVRVPNRDLLAERLRAAGVATLVHYPVPPHRMEAFADLGLREGAFPVAEAAARRLLSLPMGPHLSDAQVAYVVDSVRGAALSRAA